MFKLNTDGTGFTVLHSFAAGSGTLPPSAFTNSDGTFPSGLILSGNTLYGTGVAGGSSGNGTVFALNTDGTGFTTLHSFTSLSSNDTNSDGTEPNAGLILSGNTLYGATFHGGNSGWGTVFSISFPPPQLTITPSEASVVLSWPTYAAGFDYSRYILQSTTNLVSPPIWATVSPGPAVNDGQNVVINPISGSQQFYRLIQAWWFCSLESQCPCGFECVAGICTRVSPCPRGR